MFTPEAANPQSNPHSRKNIIRKRTKFENLLPLHDIHNQLPEVVALCAMAGLALPASNKNGCCTSFSIGKRSGVLDSKRIVPLAAILVVKLLPVPF